MRVHALAQFRIKRGIDGHLSIEHEGTGLVARTDALVQNVERRAHSLCALGVQCPELRVRADGDTRVDAEPPNVTRGRDHGFCDLMRRRLGMDLRVGNEHRSVIHDHEAQRTDRVPPLGGEHLRDVVEVPGVIAERAADQRFRLAPRNHHRADHRRVGAQDRLRQRGRNPLSAHALVVGFPVLPIASVAFRVHDLEPLDDLRW